MRKRRPVVIPTLILLAVGAVLWNRSRFIPPIDTSYTARWSVDHSSRPSFYDRVEASRIELTRSGVEHFEQIILGMRPSRNPFRIGWEHLRYWANERLYPVKLYLESDAGPRLVYYQRGRFVFLRHQYHRNDVVLVSELLPADLEAELAPFVIALRPDSGWAGRAEREPSPDSL